MAKEKKEGLLIVKEDETLDNILGGRLKILQKAKGYRFSLDALLLAHFVSLKEGERLCDMGTGSGIIPLILAHRWPFSEAVGVEIQEGLADMATRSVAFNGLDHRITIVQGDMKRTEALFSPLSFDVATANPPYRRPGSGRINPCREKALARHELTGSLVSFLQASDYILKTGGRVYVVYPAPRMVEILFRMRTYRMEPKRMRVVHSAMNSEAAFVLVEGMKGGGEELEVMPPLFIYAEEGVYTEGMRQIMETLSGHPEASAG